MGRGGALLGRDSRPPMPDYGCHEVDDARRPSCPAVSQAITSTLTLSSYGEAVKQIGILFVLAPGALVFSGERQRVREIDPGADVLLARMMLLSLAGAR
jgi:hypothetical protein